MSMVEKIGKHSKMLIQVVLILMCSMMLYYPIFNLTNIVYQSIAILSIFLFAIVFDPSIAILLACLLNIILINTWKVMNNDLSL